MNGSWQFDVGSFRCTAIRDLDNYDVAFTPLFVDTGKHKIVVDPGLGSDYFPLTTDHGSMIDRLRGLAVDPADVDLVIYSHADIDHVCGGVGDNGRPAFANARYVLLREEWDFWASMPERLRQDDAYSDEFRRLCREVPPARLVQLQDRLDYVISGDEIVAGVRLLAAPGHTPGHACVAFTSGDEHLLFTGDLFYFPEEIADPEWYAYFDYDPPLAIATRRRIFTAAARDKTLVMGFHLPFPGVGYITEVGHGWTWTAAELQGSNTQ